MSKIKINSVSNAEIQDLSTTKKAEKTKGNTLTNKACIILSVWGIILSIISMGVFLAGVSLLLVLVNKTWKKLNTSSAKWAVSLTAVSLAVNVVMTILLAI